jgi:hypothetical protein
MTCYSINTMGQILHRLISPLIPPGRAMPG